MLNKADGSISEIKLSDRILNKYAGLVEFRVTYLTHIYLTNRIYNDDVFEKQSAGMYVI